MRLYRLVRPILFSLDAERAHAFSITALKRGLPPARRAPQDPRLEVRIAGLSYPNPLGLAAGYDKNAEAPDALLRLGFGFVEVGTVTPLPQSGNQRPRIFRLAEAEAVVNRLGFNNEGHEAVRKRLETRAGRRGLIGANVGTNKDSADRVADYALGVRRFAPVADYLTINISSPNTPDLRSLQSGSELDRLLSSCMEARASAGGAQKPLFLKVAPI